MLNATVELFMSEYFLMKAVLGQYLENSENLFRALSKIFLIPKPDTEKLYGLAENQTAKAINTDKEFLQHRRMQKYSRLMGITENCNSEWEEVAGIKGNAILFAQNQNLLPEAEVSRNMVYTGLTTIAMSGVVSALRITGILRCEGIFFGKNEKSGVKNLTKTADWNDTVSTLALLYYCKDSREFNMARLRREVADTPFCGLYELAVKAYGLTGEGQTENIKLLNRAFNSGVLKREVYEPKYARILNSTALYMKDKEKFVFTQSKELVCAVADLPLKLTNAKTVPIEVKPVNTEIGRESELGTVLRAFNNADYRNLQSFRPLCFCCGSKYILDMYARLLSAKSANTHVELIDAAELDEYDFEPTPNNIFVRSIDENKDNRFLLFFCGDIDERKLDAAKAILQSSKRAKFHLSSPNLTLNLSAILPVCFCDERNVQALKPYCDVIYLSKVTEDEMPAAIENIVETKKKAYGLKDIKLVGGTAEIFKGYDIDTAEKLIDEAVRAHRENGAVLNITREILQEYSYANGGQLIGFGGNIDGKY